MVEPRERFADRLSQLRVAAGSPSLQALVDHNRTVALDRLRGLLSKAGLSDLLRGKFVRAPRWDVVEAFVDACQVLGQVRPAGLTGDLGLLCDIAQWQRWHTALVEYVQQEGLGRSAGAMRSPVDHVDNMRVVAEYREFASAVHAADLHELVVLSAAIEDRDVVPLDLVQLVIEHQVVRIIGASGTGKTHTARHAAAELTAAGYVVVWLRAGDYGQPDTRQVSDLIRAAIASCTTVEFDALCDNAARVSAGVILIVDGVNECPPSERQVFVEQLTAVFLRYQVRMIVTSTEPVSAPLRIEGAEVRVLLPSEDEREALLRSYGATAQAVTSPVFRTPYELSLAAQCVNELGADATTSDLFDAYVRRHCDSEVTRAGLCRMATVLDDRVRTSLLRSEVVAAVRRTERGAMSPGEVDNVLACSLLVTSRERVRFTHELLGRFLAAEALVANAPDGDSLCRSLADPRRADLAEFVIEAERDPDRRHSVLLGLADSNLLAEAALGRWGQDTATLMRCAVADELGRAIETTMTAKFYAASDRDSPLTSKWEVSTPRSPTSQALLAVAGRCLLHGLFVSETAVLLEATDEVSDTQVQRLRSNGHKSAVSTVIGSIIVLDDKGTDCLPAEVVASSLVLNRFNARRRQLDNIKGAATELWAAATRRKWSVLYTALMLSDPDRIDDRTLLPEFIRAGWKLDGYHLRIAVLQKVEESGRWVDPVTRAAMLAIVETFEPGGNVWLDTAYVEALAACGGMEPFSSIESIRSEIAAVLANPDDPASPSSARSIYFAQLDDESVVGPYCDALAELSDLEMLRLCLLAAQGAKDSFFLDRLIRDISDRARLDIDGARQVLIPLMAAPDPSTPFPQEAVSLHLEVLRGWSRIADNPPPSPDDTDVMTRAWWILDCLLLSLYRPDIEIPTEKIWNELSGPLAATAVGILFRLHSILGVESRPEDLHPTYTKLVTAYRGNVVRLLEWALSHHTEIVSQQYIWRSDELYRFVVRELGALGGMSSIGLLRPLVDRSEISVSAVAAIRNIERRHSSNIDNY